MPNSQMIKLSSFLQWLLKNLRKPVLRLYISAERYYTDEDEKMMMDFVTSDYVRTVEKGLIIRIGERMDVALDEKTSDKDTHATKICIAELKDILKEWQGFRERQEAQDVEDGTDEFKPKVKPVIRTEL